MGISVCALQGQAARHLPLEGHLERVIVGADETVPK